MQQVKIVRTLRPYESRFGLGLCAADTIGVLEVWSRYARRAACLLLRSTVADIGCLDEPLLLDGAWAVNHPNLGDRRGRG